MTTHSHDGRATGMRTRPAPSPSLGGKRFLRCAGVLSLGCAYLSAGQVHAFRDGRRAVAAAAVTDRDDAPDPFAFPARGGVGTSTVVASPRVSILGLRGATPVRVNGGQFRIHDGVSFGPWIGSAVGRVSPGQAVQVRHRSAATPSTTRSTDLTVGSVTARFTSTTTTAGDATPDTFSFPPRIGVDPSTVIASVLVPVQGISRTAPVSVRGGQFRIRIGSTFGPWIGSAGGSIAPGQAFQVRHTSAAGQLAERGTDLTIGGVTGRFQSTTGPRRDARCGDDYPVEATSLFVLPWPVGQTYTVGQGNCTGPGDSHSSDDDDRFAYDIDMPIGTAVLAARAGTVMSLEERFFDGNETPGEENFVTVLHGDGSISAYFHLTRGGVLVDVGATVARGETIARSGNTGDSTEPHLHFQVDACDGCSSIPVTFRNTRPHPHGLVEGQAYLAEAN